MKRLLLFLFAAGCLLVAPTLIQAQDVGLTVTCDDGSSYDNGVEIVVNQMRSGFNYTATAVGINGFDPMLAVLDTHTGDGRCNDNAANALDYSASLPTTGQISASSLSSQVIFSQNISSGMADVSLVVGGNDNQNGEFLLILEGMGVTSADGAGDMFSINITPGMVASGVPLTVYMITRGTSGVDPLIYLADSEYNVLSDADDNPVACNDAATSCWTPMDIRNSTISIATGNLWTWEKDAELSLPLDNFTLDSDRSQNFLNYVMTSNRRQTQGQYLLVFHLGINVPRGGHITGSN